MENSMSRVIIETVVKNAIHDLKRDPERSVRKLVDMTLHFSSGRFQKHFLETANMMLENEDSPYYTLIRDVASYASEERLLHLSMNIGYNSCTYGAERIRKNERTMGFNIPWLISLRMDGRSVSHLPQYQNVISEGEALGIYSWLIDGKNETAFPLMREHPDSAFFLLCEKEDITEDFLEGAASLNNLMPVIRYEETAGDACRNFRRAGMPYAVFYPYSDRDVQILSNGDLFYSAQQLSPVFTVLIPIPGCSDDTQALAFRVATQARCEQSFRTIPMELHGDNHFIDHIISDDSCTVTFDCDGNLWDWRCGIKKGMGNLFEKRLADILRQANPKLVEVSV